MHTKLYSGDGLVAPRTGLPDAARKKGVARTDGRDGRARAGGGRVGGGRGLARALSTGVRVACVGGRVRSSASRARAIG